MDVLRMVYCGCLLIILTGIYQTESGDSDNAITVCYGSGLSNFINITCSGSEQILIDQLSFVSKKSSTNCDNTIGHVTTLSCCEYDKENDCVIDAFVSVEELGSDYDYKDVFRNCTGMETCYEQRVERIQSVNHCNQSTYLRYTTYMMANYRCIPENNILKSNSNVEMNAIEVHIQNTGYPDAADQLSQVACSIETVCGAHVVVSAIDIYLEDSLEGTLTSTNNNDYQVKTVLTSADHFLIMEVNVTVGYRMWIQLNANDATRPLDVKCSTEMRSTPVNSCLSTTSPDATTPDLSTSADPMSLNPTTPADPTSLNPATPADPTSLNPATPADPTSPDSTTPADPTSLNPTTPADPTSLNPTTPADSKSQGSTTSIDQKTESTTDVISIKTSASPVPVTGYDSETDLVIPIVVTLAAIAVICIIGFGVWKYQINKKTKKVKHRDGGDRMPTQESKQIVPPVSTNGTPTPEPSIMNQGSTVNQGSTMNQGSTVNQDMTSLSNLPPLKKIGNSLIGGMPDVEAV